MELPDLASVRAFLRASCDADVVLDDLELRYLPAGDQQRRVVAGVG